MRKTLGYKLAELYSKHIKDIRVSYMDWQGNVFEFNNDPEDEEDEDSPEQIDTIPKI